MFNQPGRTFTMVMNRKMQKEVVLYFFHGSCVEVKNHVVFGVRAPVQYIYTRLNTNSKNV